MSGDRVRVLHVITRLDRGGSADNTLLTAARLDPARFASSIAVGPTREAGGPAWEEARERGVPFVEIPHLVRPISPLADLMAARELVAVIRAGRYGIVHTHTSKAGILGRLAAGRVRVPAVVHTPHGHVFTGYHGRLLTRMFVMMERWAARRTDRLIALTGREVQDHLALGIGSTERFRVIHSGVDFAPFDADPAGGAQVREELGIPAEALVIGTLGRLTAVKGQADLLAAFAAVELPRAWLLLVGDGEERLNLEAQARHLGLEGRTVFAGWRRNVYQVLRAMDIFALPSLNEGMGKALVEAMYAGLPVVATAVGGIPELVEPDCTGLLVPPRAPAELASALALLAADPNARERLGQQARLRATGYSVTRMVSAIEQVYDELIEEKGIGVTARE
ncbi:MAG: glycosyltransferase family 4 protein [Candidatus Latescibacterota bacterium]